MSTQAANTAFKRTLGPWQIMVAGVALVVAASTLVSDFSGYFQLGGMFAVALAVGFVINLLLGLSAAELSAAYPRAGALYEYARAIFGGPLGRFLGLTLGLTFFGMFAFAASGETAAGAYGLQALSGTSWDIGFFIVLLSILAVIPNILGIKTTAWVSAALLLFMLGIRWFFGLAGFFGISNMGSWSATNLASEVTWSNWEGDGGILTAGLALAFWSFVGIEFACSLAEEVKQPRKSLPMGIILGLVGILATSLLMGLGVLGTEPLAVWRDVAASELGRGGESPQLAVGYMMFGDVGYILMALASVTATLGTLTVAYASLPRIIYSIARDGDFFGPLSPVFARLHPRFGTPVNATLLCLVVYLIPALYSASVVEWLYSAAYAWILLYATFHVLAICNRKLHPKRVGAFRGRWFVPAATVGLATTLIGLYFAFLGGHVQYGGRALVVIGAALLAASVSIAMSPRTDFALTQSKSQVQPNTYELS